MTELMCYSYWLSVTAQVLLMLSITTATTNTQFLCLHFSFSDAHGFMLEEYVLNPVYEKLHLYAANS